MNPEQENFEELRRLLVLKRYEQPPPGYFNNFSAQVIARIRAQERVERASLLERLGWEAPWFQRLWLTLETRPILAGVFGMGVCGVLLAGMLYSQSVDPGPITAFAPSAEPATPVVATVEPSAMPLLNSASGYDLSNTGGVAAAQVRASLFRQLREAQPWLQQAPVEPASYHLPMNGN